MITFLGSVVHIIEETYMTTLWARGNELFDNDQETWSLWKRHNAHKNVTNVVFSNTRKANLKWPLEASFANYMWMYYKMLVACASDDEGRKYYYIMNVMFFIVTSNTFDSNQNLTFMICKSLFFTLWTCAHSELVSKPKVEGLIGTLDNFGCT